MPIDRFPDDRRGVDRILNDDGDYSDAFVAKLSNIGGAVFLPDLVLTESNLSLVPEGGGQRATATVRNAGRDRSSVAIRFRDLTTGGVIGTQTIPSLAAYSLTDYPSCGHRPGRRRSKCRSTRTTRLTRSPTRTTRPMPSTAVRSDQPIVAAVSADWDENPDPGVFGRYVGGVPAPITFRATALDPNGAADINRVIFTLDSVEYPAHRDTDGWAAEIDVGQLAGDSDLTVTAYDDEGASEPWPGMVHVVPFPSWLGVPGNDDRFVNGQYDLNGFFPPWMDVTHTVDPDWLIIGGMESKLRLGVDLGLSAGLSTSSDLPIDHEFVFEAKVLDEVLFDRSVDPFQFTLGDHVGLAFSGLAAGDDLSLAGLNATLSVGNLSLLGGPKTIAGPPMTIPIGPVPTVLQAGVSVDLTMEAQLSLGLNTVDQTIDVLPGTYFEVVAAATPYLYGGVGVSLASAGVEVAGNLDLHYRMSYDSVNGPVDQKWGAFGLTFSAVAKLGWLEARASWSPDNASWTFGDVPAGSVLVSNGDLRPDILPWPNVSADGNGNVLLTRVIDLDEDAGEIDPEIFYAMRDAAGTWSPLDAVATNSMIEGDPDAAFDGTGGAVVSWVANTMDPALIQTTAWETVLDTQEVYSAYWDGVSWSAPKAVTADSQSDGGAEVAFHDGQGLMVWEHAGGTGSTDLDGLEILYAVWNGVSKTWGAASSDRRHRR